MEQNNPSLFWTLPTFWGALKSLMSHCTFETIKCFSINFINFECFFASKHWPISTHKFWWSICQNPISCAEVMDEKVILYRFSRKHFVQCDIKNVFASYSKFVSERSGQMFSSILGWGKQLKSKFLMLYNVSIKATSPSTVSNRPISYSVTFWGSNEEVQLYKKW